MGCGPVARFSYRLNPRKAAVAGQVSFRGPQKIRARFSARNFALRAKLHSENSTANLQYPLDKKCGHAIVYNTIKYRYNMRLLKCMNFAPIGSRIAQFFKGNFFALVTGAPPPRKMGCGPASHFSYRLNPCKTAVAGQVSFRGPQKIRLCSLFSAVCLKMRRLESCCISLVSAQGGGL
jgi:hypothetical protein